MGFWDTLGNVLNPITSTITGIGDMITGGKFSEHSQKATRDANMNDWKEQQKILNQYQQDMVLFQNQQSKQMRAEEWEKYNSPQALMNAYQTAGINPNLVAGQISGSPSSLTSAGGNTSTAGGNGMTKPQLPFDPMQLGYQMEQITALKLKNDEQRILNDKLRKEQPFYEQNAQNQARILRDQAVQLFNSLNIQEKEAVKIVAETNLLHAQEDQVLQLVDNLKVEKEKSLKAISIMGTQQLLLHAQRHLTNTQREQIENAISDWQYHKDNGLREFHKSMREFQQKIIEIAGPRLKYNDDMAGWTNLVNVVLGAVPGGNPIQPQNAPYINYTSPY